MGRVSNRSRILAGAIDVAECYGIQGVTLEAVAEQVGLTKAGVQYHFASKENLMDSIEEFIWDSAEEASLNSLGKPLSESTPEERFEAYIRSSAASPARAGELLLLINAARQGDQLVRSKEFFNTWIGFDHVENNMNMVLALLAIDGLWLQDALEVPSFSGENREAIIDAILKLGTCSED